MLTPRQMADADRATIEAGTPLEVLMERAAWALARATREVLGGTYGRRVTLVCGKGNNGGDGRVAARFLEGWGVRAEVFDLEPSLDREGLVRSLERSDAAVDAMLGTGFRGTLRGDPAFAAEALDAAGVPVVACDVPTGVDGTTGAVEGPAVHAERTLCFEALKTGLLFHPGATHAGVVEVAPIGVDVEWAPGPPGHVLDGEDVGALLPRREPETHKWAVGGLFVVAGKAGMLGAANLVARSGLRSGAGIVVLGLPGAGLAARAAGGEVVTHALAETPEGLLDEPAAKEVLEALPRFRAAVVGPGLGTDERTAAAVRSVVAEAPVPVLLDADGLNCLAGDRAPLVERAGPAVLTPHAGEFARLAGEPPGDDPLSAARALAAETGAVVLLKGSTTVVAEPDGRAVLDTTGGPWLASAGTGDVLSGVVGSLLAQGVDAFEAAAAGAWLHGAAAEVAGREGLVASDLVEAIPDVLAAVHPYPERG